MESGRKMTTQERVELALFLYQEGDSYYQQGQHYHAKVRYAQSLSVFRELVVHNEAWIAVLLYSLGKISAQEGQTKQALAFFEAAAHVQQRLGEEESTADLLRELGRATAKVGDYGQAHWLLEKVSRIYQAIGLQEQSDSVQKEIEGMQKEIERILARVGSRGARAVSLDRGVDKSHEFAIQVYDQVKERFIVTADGEVRWIPVKGLDYPITFGITSWQVVSIDH